MFIEEESMAEGEKKGTVPTRVAQYLAMPVESILSHFAADLSAKPTAVYDAEFGDHQTNQKWTKKTVEGQHDQDKTLLMEYLPVMAMYSRSGWGLATQDEMTSGLQTMMETNKGIEGCPMYAIFAAKLFLGVHEVLRIDHVRSFEELLATAKRCVSIIDDWFDFSSENEPFENWPARLDDSLRRMRSSAQELVEKFGAKNPVPLKPDPSLFFKRNPVLCGLLTLNLNMLLQASGHTLVGAWGSAIYPIHLYNACQHSGGLDREWEDTEYIYQLHTPQRLFVGAPPTEPQDYHKRIQLMLGAQRSELRRKPSARREKERSDPVQEGSQRPQDNVARQRNLRPSLQRKQERSPKQRKHQRYDVRRKESPAHLPASRRHRAAHARNRRTARALARPAADLCARRRRGGRNAPALRLLRRPQARHHAAPSSQNSLA